MTRTFFIFSLLLAFYTLASAQWQRPENTMLTEWGVQITPKNAWREYPRPQMIREHRESLNGLWDYAITSNRAVRPDKWQRGSILVPFAIETPLSGVGKRINSDEVIWYRRTFNMSPDDHTRQLLNFEGVDYKCLVWVNGQLAGTHQGGNLPFSFDVTDLLKAGENELKLRVIDGTDDPDLYQLLGKQKRDNKGIWYTPSSGIWAPVWMETVPESYIASVKMLADMHGELSVKASLFGRPQKSQLKVTVFDKGKMVAEKTAVGEYLILNIRNVHRWSPSDPFLYDLKIELLDGKTLDKVSSYAGFRTVGKATDEKGNWQFTLNGKEMFQLGPLDQGWWPGSFLLPPSDKAIVWEMNFLKKAGFNMIRKHKKVEPRRYYYHADRMGFVIWQDQTSGGSGGSEWPKWKRLKAHTDEYDADNPKWWQLQKDALNADWPDWTHRQYMEELKTTIDLFYNHPSIIVWTTFNERWGQHRSMEIGKWVEAYDPSRLLNIASGGNFFEVGDMVDEHKYPHPAFPLEISLYDDYIKVVGEYGGHGWPVEGHLWDTEKNNWGYGGLPKTKEEYLARYKVSSNKLGELRKKGISAGVYTQTSDVEGEINGLITYDRKVIKIAPEVLYSIHKKAGLID